MVSNQTYTLQGAFLFGKMKHIKLSRGLFAIVDDKDFERLSEFKWYASQKIPGGVFYARNTYCGYMHRFLLGVTDTYTYVDHKDGDTLNNTRDNIRACTPGQNMANKRVSKKNKTGYKGVTVTYNGKFRADLYCDREWYYLGIFDCAKEAAIAYNKKAIEIFGDFAHINHF